MMTHKLEQLKSFQYSSRMHANRLLKQFQFKLCSNLGTNQGINIDHCIEIMKCFIVGYVIMIKAVHVGPYLSKASLLI